MRGGGEMDGASRWQGARGCAGCGQALRGRRGQREGAAAEGGARAHARRGARAPKSTGLSEPCGSVTWLPTSSWSLKARRSLASYDIAGLSGRGAGSGAKAKSSGSEGGATGGASTAGAASAAGGGASRGTAEECLDRVERGTRSWVFRRLALITSRETRNERVVRYGGTRAGLTAYGNKNARCSNICVPRARLGVALLPGGACYRRSSSYVLRAAGRQTFLSEATCSHIGSGCAPLAARAVGRVPVRGIRLVSCVMMAFQLHTATYMRCEALGACPVKGRAPADGAPRRRETVG